MSPEARSREEERHLSLVTLVIASVASASAAIVTSQFWIAGTPIAAAVTPVIVALVSEMLHRPTRAIATRLTTEADALLPAAAGAARPPPPSDPQARPGRLVAPAEPGSEPAAGRPGGSPPPSHGPVHVYGGRPTGRRRRIAVGVVAATAALAFAIAAAALTLPELIGGRSLIHGGRATTLVPVKQHHAKKSSPPQPSSSTGPGQQSAPQQSAPVTTPPTQP